MSPASERLLDQYMDALDRYGLACKERESAATGDSHSDPEVAEDRVRKARWDYCQARQQFRHRNTLAVA